MIPLPKPRGFWDYALFASALTVGLVGLFWLESNGGVGWADAGLALAAVLSVLGIILARRNEKAAWIIQPTPLTKVLLSIGGFSLVFGAIEADAYICHHKDLTASRFRRDMVVATVLGATTLLPLRRRKPVGHQLP